jgi:hypothetical protein
LENVALKILGKELLDFSNFRFLIVCEVFLVTLDHSREKVSKSFSKKVSNKFSEK